MSREYHIRGGVKVLKLPPLERVQELLYEDPEQPGVLRWRVSRGCQPAGSVAGGLNGGGRRRIVIDGVLCYASRLLWLLRTGEDPGAGVIDHEDRARDNDRFENLRLAPNGQSSNTAHSGRQSNNTSGYTGVSWDDRCGKWRVKLQYESRRIHLGFFRNVKDAYAVYLCAKSKFHGEEWLGELAPGWTLEQAKQRVIEMKNARSWELRDEIYKAERQFVKWYNRLKL
jgi:hypothetical protein